MTPTTKGLIPLNDEEDHSTDYDPQEFVYGDFYDDDVDFFWLRVPDELHTEIIRRVYGMNSSDLDDLLEYLKQK